MELRIRMSQMPETDHPPISWWRHEPKRTATGYRWLDWLTKPYWRIWLWWHSRLFHKMIDDRHNRPFQQFPLNEAELDLIECRAVLAELWDFSVVQKLYPPSSQLLTAVARQMYPAGENQDAV